MNDTSRHRLLPWVGLFVLLSLAALAAVNLWAQLQYSLHGVRATGKVVEFHAAHARSNSIDADVEVTLPDAKPFRWTVDDTFGTQDWQVDGTVPLLCTHIHADHVSCVVDSWLDRFLFPLVTLAIAAGICALVLMRWRRVASERPAARR